MQVRKIDKIEWKAFLKKCSTATFFHTPEWYEIWHQYQGNTIEAKIIEFESGNKGLITFSRSKRLAGILNHHMSSPASTYGGLITDNILSEDESQILIKYLTSFKLLYLRSNPLNNPIDLSFYTKKDFTQLIDLKIGWKEIFKKWSKGHSSAAKKGIREGVIVRKAQFQDWEEYYKVYIDTYNRWNVKGSPIYSWNLFDCIRKLSENNCNLWVALLGDRIIAGALCFYFKNHVVYWHGAALSSYFEYRPVHVLQYYIIRDAIENCFTYYDFNPSGGYVGVEKFKKGFGPVKVPTYIYSDNSRIRVMLNLVYKIFN